MNLYIHVNPCIFNCVWGLIVTDESFILEKDMSEESFAYCCQRGESLKCGRGINVYTQICKQIDWNECILLH